MKLNRHICEDEFYSFLELTHDEAFQAFDDEQVPPVFKFLALLDLSHTAYLAGIRQKRTILIPVMIDQTETPITREYVCNHIPVALFEDVQRHDHAWQQHDRKRKEREAVAEFGHRLKLWDGVCHPGL